VPIGRAEGSTHPVKTVLAGQNHQSGHMQIMFLYKAGPSLADKKPTLRYNLGLTQCTTAHRLQELE